LWWLQFSGCISLLVLVVKVAVCVVVLFVGVVLVVVLVLLFVVLCIGSLNFVGRGRPQLIQRLFQFKFISITVTVVVVVPRVVVRVLHAWHGHPVEMEFYGKKFLNVEREEPYLKNFSCISTGNVT
jgi:hypothetical protein